MLHSLSPIPTPTLFSWKQMLETQNVTPKFRSFHVPLCVLCLCRLKSHFKIGLGLGISSHFNENPSVDRFKVEICTYLYLLKNIKLIDEGKDMSRYVYFTIYWGFEM